jgi:hypothetical protein
MIQNISKGSGFRGATAYVVNKANAVRLGCGTMAGSGLQELSREAAEFRKLRPQLNKACFHVSIGLPPGETLGNDKWEEFATEYMSRMGFENAPWFAARHDDTDHQHIHIVALRIDDKGNAITDSKDFERGAKILQDFEQRWNLTAGAKTPGQAWQGAERGITFAEMGKYKRTGEVPEKLKIKEIIQTALAGNPSVPEFSERLDMAGVSMLPNISPKTGHVAGISFALGGVAVKGSGLGKAFSWAGLQKQGLKYSKTKDKDLLVGIMEANKNEHNNATKINRKARNDDSNTSSSTASTNTTTKPGNHKADTKANKQPSSSRGTTSSSYVPDSTANSNSDKQIQQGDGKLADKDRQSSSNTANSNNSKQNKHIKSEQTASSNQQKGKSGDRKTDQDFKGQKQENADFNSVFSVFDGDSAWGRVVLLGANKLFKLQNNEFAKAECCNISQAGLEAIKPHLQQKIKAFRQQHRALQAPFYRITLVDTSSNKPGYNLGKQKEKNERFFTAKEVEAKIPFLSAKNSEGYNIYITPISEEEHYCVLDDTTKDGVNALYKKTGITPCLCQESSPGNWQAIFRVAGPDGSIWESEERSIGNKIVQTLNQNFGDKKFSGVTHPFRLAGFANRKEKYNKNGKYPFVTVKHCKPGIDAVLSNWFKNARIEQEKQKQDKKYIQEQEQIKQEQQKRLENISSNARLPLVRGDELDKVYAKSFVAVKKWVQDNGWQEDLSRFDWQIAKSMYSKNYDIQQVKQAILNNSPGLADRHVNVDDYIERTAVRAFNAVQAEKNNNKNEDLQRGIK